MQLGSPGGPAEKVGWKHRPRAGVKMCLERVNREGLGLGNWQVQRPGGRLL